MIRHKTTCYQSPVQHVDQDLVLLLYHESVQRPNEIRVTVKTKRQVQRRDRISYSVRRRRVSNTHSDLILSHGLIWIVQSPLIVSDEMSSVVHINTPTNKQANKQQLVSDEDQTSETVTTQRSTYSDCSLCSSLDLDQVCGETRS